MKFGIMIIVIIGALLLIRSQLYPQDANPGTDSEELEMLKDAWKRHKEEKREESPGSANSESRDPLEALQGKMKAIERRLGRQDTGEKTMEKQREALDMLDDLIKKAQEAQAQSESQGGGSEKESEPKPQEGNPDPKPGSLTDPSGRDNPATPGMQRKKEMMGKKEEQKELRYKGMGGTEDERWGTLKGRVMKRDLESGSSEERPPKYQRWIDRYYDELLKSHPGK